MLIIGCDDHPGFQQIALVDTETGDCGEQRVEHCEGAQKVCRDLATQGKKGACGDGSQWTRALVRATAVQLKKRLDNKVDDRKHR